MFNKTKLREVNRCLERCNLIVIGDTIVDRYAACEALGMSAEAPVVVVKEIQNRTLLEVPQLLHLIRNLGAQCKLISVIEMIITVNL